MGEREFAMIQELADAVGWSAPYVVPQLRLANLAPEVLKRQIYGGEASTVALYGFCPLAGKAWAHQLEPVF